MLIFILRRLGVVVPTFFGVTVFAFTLIHMIPGDPILVLAGERGLSDERYAEFEAQLGLDRPLILQYLSYVTNVILGDFGDSMESKAPVIEEFLSRFPATIELSVAAMIIAVIVGLPAGIIAAINRGRWPDHLLMGASLIGYSMPIFWWALILIVLFSTGLGWTPVSGRLDLLYFFDQPTGFMLIDSLLSGQSGAFQSALRHLILPAVVLATIPLAVIARMTRSAMLEVLADDYIRTARAKGLGPGRIIGVHALRNALIPVVTVIGLQVGSLFAGAILTETIFSWPGIGKWMVDAIQRRDYPAVQGGILLIATTVIFVNLTVDVIYGVINPRIRHAR